MKRILYLIGALLVAASVSASELNVMTFNMRYDNPEDGVNNWRHRKGRVAGIITSRDIDVVGTQELLNNQLQELRKLLPEYEAVGVGRENGKKKGEYNAIFFRRDRFTLLDSGTFWLSETPEKAGSKGWDGACERIATWAVLRDRTGEEFLFINTHLDHRGRVARQRGVTLLMDRIGQLSAGREVILTGDFNASPWSAVIAHVGESGLLQHVKETAAEVAGPGWSFSDFGEIPEDRRTLIDYIFVSDGVQADRYEVLPDHVEQGYLSDHAPVMATIRIEKNEQ